MVQVSLRQLHYVNKSNILAHRILHNRLNTLRRSCSCKNRKGKSKKINRAGDDSICRNTLQSDKQTCFHKEIITPAPEPHSFHFFSNSSFE